jgi:hypothetical protein
MRNLPADRDIIYTLPDLYKDLDSYDESEDEFLQAVLLCLAFIVAGLVYGALHLLAWQAPFVSDRERILWRISATSIAASGPVILDFLIIFSAV